MFEKNKITLKNASTCEKVINPNRSQSAVQSGFGENGLSGGGF
jgi:hypothetical protein